MFEILGIAGVVISVVAYLPQVVHLGREHCSAGVSSHGWAMWLISSLLIGALALHQREPVFIALQVINLISISVTLWLARRYRGMVCEHHAHLAPSRPATTTSGKIVPMPSTAAAIASAGSRSARARACGFDLHIASSSRRASPVAVDALAGLIGEELYVHAFDRLLRRRAVRDSGST